MESNKQQLQAINSKDRTILCLAGAGAGKTYVFVKRIVRLVDEGVDPKSILALTFTNAAAFEMESRFKKYSSSKIIPEFRTFHGFCYSLIVKDVTIREKLGYSKIPEICTDIVMKRVMAETKLQLNCKLSEDALSGKCKPVNKKEEQELLRFQKGLKRNLLLNNLITFDIMCYEVSDLFVQHDPCTDKYIAKYKHIFVDEFQDTDPKQMKFVSSFGAGANYFLVGDALQSIYGFRGCSDEFIKMLSRDPSWTVIKLFENYRSTIQICEFANKMSKYAKPEYRIEMHGQTSGDDVTVVYGSSTNRVNIVESSHITKLVKMLGESKEECAVLCRTNREVKFVCEQLTAHNIPYATSIRDDATSAMFRAAVDNEFMLKWLASMLDAEKYASYIRTSSQQRIPDIRWFLQTFGSVQKVNKYGKKIIKLREALSGNMDTATKIKKVSSILERDIEIPDKEMTTSEVIEYISHAKQVENPPVYVGTIHSVKGLEYESVFIMGVNDGVFKLDSEESKNMYYVAITRAKNHLTVFRA